MEIYRICVAVDSDTLGRVSEKLLKIPSDERVEEMEKSTGEKSFLRGILRRNQSGNYLTAVFAVMCDPSIVFTCIIHFRGLVIR